VLPSIASAVSVKIAGGLSSVAMADSRNGGMSRNRSATTPAVAPSSGRPSTATKASRACRSQKAGLRRWGCSWSKRKPSTRMSSSRAVRSISSW
jgi:hypothetical protein